MNRLTKESDGITLIALIVSIIVILILAGVSIAVLTGENRDFKQSNWSKTNKWTKNGRGRIKTRNSSSINRLL